MVDFALVRLLRAAETELRHSAFTFCLAKITIYSELSNHHVIMPPFFLAFSM